MHDRDGEPDAEQRPHDEAEQRRGERHPAVIDEAALGARGDQHGGLVDLPRHLMRRGQHGALLVERGGDQIGGRIGRAGAIQLFAGEGRVEEYGADIPERQDGEADDEHRPDAAGE